MVAAHPFPLQLLRQRPDPLARVRLVLEAGVQQLVLALGDVGQRALQLEQHLPQLLSLHTDGQHTPPHQHAIWKAVKVSFGVKDAKIVEWDLHQS
eukprot:scaffold99088_cov22-Prasinocladus_malaysianus.AAC.1